jgi:hypothetical protein
MTRGRSRGLGPPRRLLWDVCAVAACAALAAVSALEVYGTPYVAVVALTGFVIALAVVLIGAARGWRWWTIALAASAAYVLAVLPVAMPEDLTSLPRAAAGLVEGLAGIVTGWKHLLTISVPAGMYQGVLVPFFLTVLAASAAALSIMVFRPERAGFAMLPMLAMVTFGAVFGSSQSSAPAAVGPASVVDARRSAIAIAAVVVCVAWSLARARINRGIAMGSARAATGTARLGASSLGFALRRQGAAAAIIAAVVVGTLALAPVAEALGTRIVPRDAVDPVVYLNDQPSALADYRRYFDQPAYDTALFVVGGGASTDRIRIATLDSYDGQVFRVAGETQFTRQPLSQDGDMTITIGEGYRGAWVPLATAAGGQPRFIGSRADALADAYYANVDVDAGAIIDADGAGLEPGDSYTVASATSPPPDELTAARGGDSRIDPDRYPLMAAWVERQGLGRTGADLIELVDRLRERGYLSHASRASVATQGWTTALDARADYVFHGSRPGHSAARVDELFGAILQQEQRAGDSTEPGILVAAIGDDEQFAAAVALLGALLGFDSRVVVGVRLGDAGSELGVPPCDDVCTGANLTAWAEIRSPNGVWVPLDATPQFSQSPVIVQEGQTPPQNPTEPEQAQSSVVEPPAVANDATTTVNETPPSESPWLDQYLPIIIAVLVSLAGLGILLAPLLVFPLAKSSRRRWRRRRNSVEVSLVGAWEELVDSYVDLGIEVPRGLTRAETADVLGRPVAATIAATVDEAVFGEARPSAQTSESTWRLLDAERRAVAKELPWRRRARARLSASSLRRAGRAPARGQRLALLRKDRRELL